MKLLNVMDSFFNDTTHGRSRSALLGRYARITEFFPLTRLGVLIALCISLGLWYFGFYQHDLVWYVAAVSGFALIFISLVSVCLATNYVHKSLPDCASYVSQECVTDIPWTTDFVLPNLRFFPFIDVQLKWVLPRTNNVESIFVDRRRGERITLFEHGNFHQVQRLIIVKDTFGLASISLRYSSSANIAVLPNRGRLGSIPWMESLNDGEDLPHHSGAEKGDRIELQHYDALSPARFIHWGAYARTRELIQRKPERSISQVRRTAVYLVAGIGDGASAAAALAVLEANAMGIDWVFGTDGMSVPLTSKTEVEAAIRCSASHRAQGGEGLANYIAGLKPQGVLNLMLFLPSITGKWEVEVMAVLANPNLSCTVIIGNDGFQRHRQRSFWHRFWYRPTTQLDANPLLDIRALDQMVGRFAQIGASVLIVDRFSGRTLTRAQLGVLALDQRATSAVRNDR